MCYEEYGTTVFGKFSEDVFRDDGTLRIQADNRFIDEEEFWFMEE